MKTRTGIVVLILSMVMGSCSYFKHKNTGPEKTDFPMLDSVQVLKYDTLKNYFPSADAIAYGRKLYNDALGFLDKKNKAQESLPLFLKSIRIAPEPFKYLKYGHALYANGEYEKASKVYYFTESYDEQNMAPAMLGFARCESMKDNKYALEYLSNALVKFPFDMDDVMADKAFEKYHDNEEFKILIAKYTVDDETRKAALMAIFEKNFAKGTLPYSITESMVHRHDASHIDIRFADLIPDLEAMEYEGAMECDYQYLAKLELSADFKTFIYSKVDYHPNDTAFPVHFFLATIDLGDSLIARQEIACSCSPFTIKTAVVDSDGVIEVKEIAQTWKEDPLYKGYANNSIVKQEQKDVKLYQVTGEGKIEVIKERILKYNGGLQSVTDHN